MPHAASWASYLVARRAALAACADTTATASVGRAERRLAQHLDLAPGEARRQARRSLLYAVDAAFHDQLLGTGRIDALQALIDRTAFAPPRPGAAVAVSLHYGPATSLLPLCLARACAAGRMPAFAVIQNSRRNAAVMLAPERQAELSQCGFPLIDLDIARLGEVGALRRALAILRTGGTVLIFADGQFPRTDAKGAITCRLGRGALTLAHGAEWLARTAGVPLLPLLVRPTQDFHRVDALPRAPAACAASTFQRLIDAALQADPAPWSRWGASAAQF